MLRLSPHDLDQLLDILQELPATADRKQRSALLFGLPTSLTAQIDRSDTQFADLTNILTTLQTFGQLRDGRWAMDVLLHNAMRMARDSAVLWPKLEEIRAIFDLGVRVQIPSLPEAIASEVSYLMPVDFLTNGYRASASVARLL